MGSAGFRPRTATELASISPLLPEAPIYLDGRLYAFWSDGRYAESLRWLTTEGRNAAQHPWQTVAIAHARALTGDTAGALADYASALEGTADREVLFNNWYPTRFGPAQLANWIALRKAQGLEHSAELADYAARLDRATEGGTAIPVIEYHRAALAALRDDPRGADQRSRAPASVAGSVRSRSRSTSLGSPIGAARGSSGTCRRHRRERRRKL